MTAAAPLLTLEKTCGEKKSTGSVPWVCIAAPGSVAVAPGHHRRGHVHRFVRDNGGRA